MKKAINSVLLSAVLLCTGVGCAKENKSKTLEGVYVLQSATLNNKSVKSDFNVFNITFKSDHTMSIVINESGSITMRSSTYTFNGKKLVESYGNKKFEYFYEQSDETFILYYETFDGDVEITLANKNDVEVDGPVDYNEVLFGESVRQTKKYNYCPAILMEEKDGKNVMNVWYCTNKSMGVIVDYIGYRQGVQNEDGKWEFGEESIVIEPTEGTWDARHTCDPAVIGGEFKLGGETYNYLMAYLGCVTDDYQKNETGIAVAKDVGGPWVKIGNAPIVPWYDDGDEAEEEAKYQANKGTDKIYWGTGMPSLLSVDGKGEVILFNVSTKNGTTIRRIDLSNLENPVFKGKTTLSSNGILNSQNMKCNIGIPDFAYDPSNGRLYVVGTTNEKNPADVTKTLVSSHSVVAYLEGLSDMEAVWDTLVSRTYVWKNLGIVGPAQTGWERNHNPAIMHDINGHIPDPTKINVMVSTGHNSWANENIFTYRLHGWSFDIK